MTDKDLGSTSPRHDQASVDEGTQQPSPSDPGAALAALIDTLIANPPKLARASAKGKFPIASMRSLDGGKTLSMFPLTVAMDEATFEQIRDLIGALIAYRPLLGEPAR